jgi:hypothetical protein
MCCAQRSAAVVIVLVWAVLVLLAAVWESGFSRRPLTGQAAESRRAAG